MGESREVLLNRIIDGVANDGLVDRSLRELAASAGTSHRMLIYHFGSREGVVSAIVEEIERRQRLMMIDLAAECPDAPTLIRRLWDQVSSMELRPFVRLFFESLASTSRGEAQRDMTKAWISDGADAASLLGRDVDYAMLRLGTAVTRGLLIDVLSTGDVDSASQALDRFIEMWEHRGMSS